MSNINSIGLTDSELRIVIESLRLACSELDTLKQTEALLKCLELNWKCKGDK